MKPVASTSTFTPAALKWLGARGIVAVTSDPSSSTRLKMPWRSLTKNNCAPLGRIPSSRRPYCAERLASWKRQSRRIHPRTRTGKQCDVLWLSAARVLPLWRMLSRLVFYYPFTLACLIFCLVPCLDFLLGVSQCTILYICLPQPSPR